MMQSLGQLEHITVPETTDQKRNYCKAVRKETKQYAFLCFYIEEALKENIVVPREAKYICHILKSIAGSLSMALDGTLKQIQQFRQSGGATNFVQEVNLFTLLALHGKMHKYVAMLSVLAGTNK